MSRELRYWAGGRVARWSWIGDRGGSWGSTSQNQGRGMKNSGRGARKEDNIWNGNKENNLIIIVNDL